MADKHPYVQGPGALVQAVTHFRNSFPATVNASTLQKLGVAPNNESYVLNVLRFLGLIDEDGKKTDAAAKTFNLHDDGAFAEAFAQLVEKAYSDLFDLHRAAAWDLENFALITFFRSNDDTTALVGRLQASTFRALAAYSGHGDLPTRKHPTRNAPKSMTKKSAKKPLDVPKRAASPAASAAAKAGNEPRFGGLTVRIEVNLPADGDQETYDRIFRSIREYLLNG